MPQRANGVGRRSGRQTAAQTSCVHSPLRASTRPRWSIERRDPGVGGAHDGLATSMAHMAAQLECWKARDACRTIVVGQVDDDLTTGAHRPTTTPGKQLVADERCQAQIADLENARPGAWPELKLAGRRRSPINCGNRFDSARLAREHEQLVLVVAVCSSPFAASERALYSFQ